MRALRLWLSLIRLSEWQALAITSLVILLQMAGVKALSSRRMVSTEVSRKALHIGTGLLFILCWPLFPNTNEAPYWAAALPALITLRFLLIGLGVVRDPDTVRSMARWGGARELLKGPLLYGLVFVTSTMAFWRTHPAGITSLVLLCAGDGFAGLCGGGRRLPWNRAKSWRGLIAFVAASVAFSSAYMWLFAELGLLRRADLTSLVVVAVVGALVESYTSSDWDNLTVFAACALVSTHLHPR